MKKKISMKKIISFLVLTFLLVAAPEWAVAQNFSYISNGSIKIGAITDWGAGIGYFSRVSPERNLLNYSDKGREIQQSYYGDDYPGVTWAGQPWGWNPVQAGDAFGNPSQVVTFTNDGTTIYAKTIPLDWALNNKPIAGYMEEWVTLSGDIAKIHFKFTYTGSTTQGSRDQEVPAVFVDYALPNLVYYGGSSPWNSGALKQEVPPTWPGQTPQYNVSTTENWAAYVDNTSWGIGVYTPNSNHKSFYLYNGPTGPTGAGCSYMNGLIQRGFHPGDVYEYDVYLTIGTLTEIRSRFYAIHGGQSGGSITLAAPQNLRIMQ